MRMDFDEYCMEVAETVAKRSTCLRRQVGAVIVVGKHIVATGYNGAAAELDHCDEKGECRELETLPGIVLVLFVPYGPTVVLNCI